MGPVLLRPGECPHPPDDHVLAAVQQPTVHPSTLVVAVEPPDSLALVTVPVSAVEAVRVLDLFPRIREVETLGSEEAPWAAETLVSVLVLAKAVETLTVVKAEATLASVQLDKAEALAREEQAEVISVLVLLYRAEDLDQGAGTLVLVRLDMEEAALVSVLGEKARAISLVVVSVLTAGWDSHHFKAVVASSSQAAVWAIQTSEAEDAISVEDAVVTLFLPRHLLWWPAQGKAKEEKAERGNGAAADSNATGL